MTLPASGTISLNQVNTELNLTATAPITMNDTAVRRLAGVPTAGTTISMSNLRGKSNNWIETTSPSATSQPKVASVIDSSGNIYVFGYNGGTGVGVFQKLDPLGALVWGTQTSGIFAPYNARMDNAGNIYVVGQTSGGGALLMKINQSGTLLWQRSSTIGTAAPAFFTDVAFDSSDNVYLVGLYRINTSTACTCFIQKWNSAGSTLAWSATFAMGAGAITTFKPSAVVDSTGTNLFVCSGNVIGKYTASTGALVWHRRFTNPNSDYPSQSIARDSANNLYVTGGAGSFISLIKLDSNGVISWQTSTTVLNSSTIWYRYAGAVAVDSSDNPYIVGALITETTNTNLYTLLVAKFTSSGALTWQRTFKNASYSLSVQNNAQQVYAAPLFDTLGNVYVNALIYSPTNLAVQIKMPNTGGKTGTYTVATYSIVYATSTLTFSAPANTIAGVTLTVSTFTTTAVPAQTLSAYTPVMSIAGMT